MGEAMSAVIAIVILTYNEERHIERCIRSIHFPGCEVVVVDSFSTDSTVEIARSLGASVVQHAFVTQAKQFQWALDNLAFEAQWVMRLDADEVITPELHKEIERRLPLLAPEIMGVNLKRRHIFMGRWIKHGGRYPVILLRIWRRGTAEVEQRWMDEHIVLRCGGTITFEHDFIDHNLNDLSFFTDKHNKYATREAVDVLVRRYGLNEAIQFLSKDSTSLQAAGKRWVKQNLYNNLPFWIGPIAYVIFRYVIQAGFLDGREGLVYHCLQGFWYRFLVGAKVMEFDRSIRSLPDRIARLHELGRLSGYHIGDIDREERFNNHTSVDCETG